MDLEPDVSIERYERYDFKLQGRRFEIEYLTISLEREGKTELLDDHTTLYEKFTNKYGNPIITEGLKEKLYGGHKIKREIIRTVTRAFELPEGKILVEIQQWKDIPEGLEKLMDDLPTPIKEAFRTEYTDENILPYDFGFPIE